MNDLAGFLTAHKDTGEPLAPALVQRRIFTGAWTPVEATPGHD